MDRYTETDLLPLSGIQHFAYCPRQWGLIHIETQWIENLGTAQGRLVHERVDDPFFQESRGETTIERAVPLVSRHLGLFGVADLLEMRRTKEKESKTLTLVEYKRGKPKPDDRDEVQICAQAICLEEMRGITLRDGFMYYDAVKHRHQVVFTLTLRQRVKELCAQMHALYNEGRTPEAIANKKCKNCSMENVCLPKLSKLKGKANRYMKNYLQELENEL